MPRVLQSSTLWNRLGMEASVVHSAYVAPLLSASAVCPPSLVCAPPSSPPSYQSPLQLRAVCRGARHKPRAPVSSSSAYRPCWQCWPARARLCWRRARWRAWCWRRCTCWAWSWRWAGSLGSSRVRRHTVQSPRTSRQANPASSASALAVFWHSDRWRCFACVGDRAGAGAAGEGGACVELRALDCAPQARA